MELKVLKSGAKKKYQTWYFNESAQTVVLPLSKGSCIIDLEDYYKVSQYTWNDSAKGSNTNYIVTTIGTRKNNNRKTLRLHRVLMSESNFSFIDHKNGDGYDNRKDNLRFCTRSDNAANSKKMRKKVTSVYKGVRWFHKTLKWKSCLRINGKLISLGTFKHEIDAALAYDLGATKYFGEFAKTNF